MYQRVKNFITAHFLRWYYHYRNLSSSQKTVARLFEGDGIINDLYTENRHCISDY